MQRVVEALTTRTDRETIRVDTAVVMQHRSENTSSLDEQRIVRHVEASAIGIALGRPRGWLLSVRLQAGVRRACGRSTDRWHAGG